jgi:(p)ppGpp synthase/HD superfamily hydrolase
MQFAREVHKDQRRKYTNAPYADHLAEVAGIASTVAGTIISHEEMCAVAWLHDVMEDQKVGMHALVGMFGWCVANGVLLLSDLETGSRAERKRLSLERLSKAPGWVQTIKVADLISNTSSIVTHYPKFAMTYLEEKRMLLDVMTRADPRLVEIAREQTA